MIFVCCAQVTGLEFVTVKGTERLLVTTSDSRVRLYNLEDFSMAFKYKGPTNNNLQIRATCKCALARAPFCVRVEHGRCAQPRGGPRYLRF